MAICKFYLQGRCRNGNQCDFLHGTSQADTDAPQKKITTQFREKGQSSTLTRTQRNERKMLKAVEEQIDIIEATVPDHDADARENVQIADYQFLGSFNWKDTIKPIIYVPGCPAKWTPPAEIPHQLQKDNGRAILAQRGYRLPAAPVDPFFQALLHLHPDYDMRPVELVTDRNSLRKLLDFASEKSGSWRIDVDLIGDTMFLSQWEVERIKIINGEQNTGYGHEFEKAFTTFDSGMEDSISHNRIVRYKLGGMDCVVRFEADAYVESAASSTKSTSDDEIEGKADSALESMMAAVSIKGKSITSASTETSKGRESPYGLVEVIPNGRLVDPADIAEVKSRAQSPSLAKVMPQLWFSQTKNLCVGIHKGGLIEKKVEVQNMEGKLAEWETKNQSNLRNLLQVIRKIKDMARNVEGGKSVVILNQGPKLRALKIYRRGGRDLVIRAGIKEKCWGDGIKV